jgi:hypothetical protein
MRLRLAGDFNGLFSEVLCLSHEETCTTPEGREVEVTEGMLAVAREPDTEEDGTPSELFATGTIERPPDWLACRGSRWVLRLEPRGVRWRPPTPPSRYEDP